MLSERLEFTVAELIKAGVLEKPIDGNHGETHPKSKDYVPTGIPFVMASDMISGRIDTSNCKFITKKQADSLRKGFAKTGDVLLSHKATIGRTAIVEETVDDYVMLTPQVTYYRIKDQERLNNRYLRYYFDSAPFQELFNQWAGGGSTRAYLGITGQQKLPIVIPPLPEQKAIAHILGSLDDKIELNRRMNATLEGMAQALFKSWFVDFDPVIDNALAAGNPIPEEFADRAEIRRQAMNSDSGFKSQVSSFRSLFPDAFQSSELGPIPSGWEERPIGDCFRLLGGHSFKSGDYIEDGVYGVVTIMNVQDGSFVQNCSSRITALPEKMKEYCLLNTGDVLLSLTGNVGRVCLVSDGSYVLNQRVSKIVGIDEISEAFSYFYFRQEPLYERMITIAKGTAQQNLSPIETAKLKQAMPSNETIKSLSPVLDGYYKKMIGNISESQTLTQLRDTLLPKLISGELRIEDAEKIVGDTGV